MEATYEKIGPMTIWGHMWNSMRRVLVGFCIASVSGILLGLAMGWNRTCEAIFRPIFELLRPHSPLAWISLAIVWFGLGEGGKYFIIFVSRLFQCYHQCLHRGESRGIPEVIGAAKMLGCPTHGVFLHHCAAVLCALYFYRASNRDFQQLGAVVAAEMVRSTNGIGWLITAGQSIGDMGQVMVGIIVIGVVGFLLATIMRGVESKLCRLESRAGLMSYVIECEHISKTFDTPTGEFQVIKDISIQAMQNEILVLFGPGAVRQDDTAEDHCWD